MEEASLKIVLKIGGSLLAEDVEETELASDIEKIASSHSLVIVHGGGRDVTRVCERMGKKPIFVTSPEGFRSRYTDLETLEIYIMVMAGKVNKELVAYLKRRGLNAIGLSGVDGGILKAERKKKLVIIDERGRKRVIEGGYTGRIVSVNAKLLDDLLELGYLPVVAPIALGTEGEMLNVDGDRAAAYIAGAMKADILILTTDVDALYVKGKPVPRLNLDEAKKVLKDIGPGMITKIYASTEALAMGVKKVHICSGRGESPLVKALEGIAGTVIER